MRPAASPDPGPASHAAANRFRVWFALFAPPAAWFIALNACYFLVSWACGSGAGRVALHLVCLATLATAAAAGVTGFSDWRRLGGGWPGESADPRARAHFLAVLATASGALFSLIIIAQWLAVVLLSPCEPGPNPPLGPDALLPLRGPATL